MKNCSTIHKFLLFLYAPVCLMRYVYIIYLILGFLPAISWLKTILFQWDRNKHRPFIHFGQTVRCVCVSFISCHYFYTFSFRNICCRYCVNSAIKQTIESTRIRGWRQYGINQLTPFSSSTHTHTHMPNQITANQERKSLWNFQYTICIY